MIQFSICIPTYNRVNLLFDSFKDVIDDPRVLEVVISDDHSRPSVYNELSKWLKGFPKISLYQNSTTRDCYFNKWLSIDRAKGEYVLLLDSDNHIGVDYLDTIYANHWSPERILQPTFAKPHFDFRKFESLLANKTNVSKYVGDSTFTTALNAANYFVNRSEYLRIWDAHTDPVTSDSIFMAYNWLKNGNSIYFTPGLQYDHRVEDHGTEEPSHYGKFNKRTPPGFHESIVKKLRQLR